MTARRVIHWFRRDLRLHDNLALTAALDSGDPVLPVFAIDRSRPEDAHGLQPRLLRAAVSDLDRQLRARGSRLLVLAGEDVPRELNRLAQDTGAWALYFNRDPSPEVRDRDTRATRGMQLTGVVTLPFDDFDLVPPHRVMDPEGRIPGRFDEFLPRWLEALDVPPEAPVPSAAAGFVPFGEVPEDHESWHADPVPDPAGAAAGATRASALARLDAFVLGDLARLGSAAAAPGQPGAVAPEAQEEAVAEGLFGLDTALQLGTLSAREVVRGAMEQAALDPRLGPAVEDLVRLLARRDHRRHRLFAGAPGGAG